MSDFVWDEEYTTVRDIADRNNIPHQLTPDGQLVLQGTNDISFVLQCPTYTILKGAGTDDPAWGKWGFILQVDGNEIVSAHLDSNDLTAVLVTIGLLVGICKVHERIMSAMIADAEKFRDEMTGILGEAQ